MRSVANPFGRASTGEPQRRKKIKNKNILEPFAIKRTRANGCRLGSDIPLGLRVIVWWLGRLGYAHYRRSMTVSDCILVDFFKKQTNKTNKLTDKIRRAAPISRLFQRKPKRRRRRRRSGPAVVAGVLRCCRCRSRRKKRERKKERKKEREREREEPRRAGAVSGRQLAAWKLDLSVTPGQRLSLSLSLSLSSSFSLSLFLFSLLFLTLSYSFLTLCILLRHGR